MGCISNGSTGNVGAVCSAPGEAVGITRFEIAMDENADVSGNRSVELRNATFLKWTFRTGASSHLTLAEALDDGPRALLGRARPANRRRVVDAMHPSARGQHAAKATRVSH